jgi:predicted metal-dependent phosphoesterase TrpH
LIDLHLHTTASDGALQPAALVARAAGAGLTVLSITDHDTLAGLPEARAAAARHGLRLVNGVEITAVENRRDVHMLGYFIDSADAGLATFLDRQRADRVRRLRQIADRLQSLGCPIDADALVAAAGPHSGRSIGRPQIAAALVAAGHARDPDDAFDRFIGENGPAYVPRRGATPDEVIDIVARAGGIVSMAHPGVTKIDGIIPRLAAAGLTALEARHSDHDFDTEQRYRELAALHGLATSGGSDFHGDYGHRAGALGVVTLRADDFATLESRLESPC